MAEHTFEATLYRWEAQSAAWTFVDLPFDVADEIEDAQQGPRRGFGAVKVDVALGGSRWRTSIFPSKERKTFVLPVKQAILRAEAIANGDRVTVTVTPVS
ncbi:DUF1905 domain-containing protein [Demequina lignilytica]|uniref:DUF1905 domain-containing protein n=1 Tax=Demequina lignilytica TaxID=3051663 RepID=A0AAW7M118_9MICO|nr:MULTISPECIES: DUF1905 domain-containing protein [unclassified Demequina]MDN4478509.1 DUF1905 domain-containing protein [Demequina sp. SYSU T00039-1]MDN4482333.1 DUF1905 domain-containing protein [Demequina sp. SYSU T0a273]MDN4486984.1 DUF1905 domain-containing protein [Demequina sp. SYSU T00039]MDN4489668.1 DUF1905 domain-containing protein [Demequina sp. SYSU T00068]